MQGIGCGKQRNFKLSGYRWTSLTKRLRECWCLMEVNGYLVISFGPISNVCALFCQDWKEKDGNDYLESREPNYIIYYIAGNQWHSFYILAAGIRFPVSFQDHHAQVKGTLKSSLQSSRLSGDNGDVYLTLLNLFNWHEMGNVQK